MMTDSKAEVLVEILDHFSPVQLAMFSRTCTYFQGISSDEKFWKKYHLFQFGEKLGNS